MLVNYLRHEPIAENIFSFYFSKPEGLEYQAGQYTQIHLPMVTGDERGPKRFFTISASPTEPELAITTKVIAEPSRFKSTLYQLGADTELELAEPSGDFTLPEDPIQPIIFVAGGIGVTPYRSMIKFCVDTNRKQPIHLIYAAKSEAEFAFKDLFGNIRTDYHIGPLSAEVILQYAPNAAEQLVYLSGPEPMVEALETECKAAGISQLKTDFFPGYTEI